MRFRPLHAVSLLLLLLVASVGARCGPLRKVVLSSPDANQLWPSAAAVGVSGRVGQVFDPATVALEIDGVDLVAALGLVPPFTDAFGSVLVGGEWVGVSGFTYDPTQPGEPRIQAALAGLPAGPHSVTLSAQKTADGEPGSDVRDFRVVDGFALELSVETSVGLPDGPVATETPGFLANQALGPAVAAPPIAIAGGGTLRSGHVEAVEGRVAAGGN
jgi:hypothetical protein